MVIDFSVANFRSFREEQRISFVAASQYRDLPENLIDPKLDGAGFSKLRLLKGLAVYGPNAAGKTNVLKALAYLRHMVQNSATSLDEGDPTGVEPFALSNEFHRQPSEFVLRFVVDGVRYHFVLVLNSERVLFESLSAFPNGREQVWYEREWDDEKASYNWSPARPTDYRRDTNRVKYTRDNALYLSTAVKFNDDQLKPIYGWFKENVRFLRLSSSRSSISPRFTIQRILEDPNERDLITHLLKNADLGVLSAEASERELQRGDLPNDLPDQLVEKVLANRKHFDVSLGHRGVKGEEFHIPWLEESAGTQQLFSLAGPWLDVLRNGYFCGLDEIELSMHPAMVNALLKLFFAEESNSEGAQILFTTHDPLVLDMNVIRRDQVWFADKDEEGGTHLYPLTDYKPRNKESLIRGYMAGRYGAVPFIPQGLLTGISATHGEK